MTAEASASGQILDIITDRAIMIFCQIHCAKWREIKESRINLRLGFHGFMGVLG